MQVFTSNKSSTSGRRASELVNELTLHTPICGLVLEMSKTTLTDLINEALAVRKDYQLMKTGYAALILANNALEERLQEIIETKVNQMLKRV